MKRISLYLKIYLIPILFVIVLAFSILKIVLFDYENKNINFENAKYIDGFVCKSSWNKSNQLLFLSRDNRRILLNIWDESLLEELSKGEHIRIFIDENDIVKPRSARNEGEFDYRKYLATKDVFNIITPVRDDIEPLEGGEKCFFVIKTGLIKIIGSITDLIKSSLNEILGERYSGTAIGILTGDTAYISNESMENYRKSGISHIMAVSGMHIGFIQGIVSFFVSNKYISNSKRSVICILVLFLYAAIAGFSPSVSRAMLQSTYTLLGKAVKKPVNKTNSLCLASTIQMIINPYILFSSGFILSYAAAVSITFIKPIVSKKIYFFGRLPEWLAVGISVNLGIFPLMIYYFNSFSLVGILATVFAGKLAYAICLCGFLICIMNIFPFFDVLIKIPAIFTTSCVEIMEKISLAGSGVPAPVGAIIVPSWSFSAIILYYCILIFVLKGKLKNIMRRKKVIIVLIIISVIYFVINNNTEIVFIDVGQGLSVLVKFEGMCGLIDTGEENARVGELLLKQGVGKLDFVILTHGHSDHTGGLENILKTQIVKQIIMPYNSGDKGIEKAYEIASKYDIEVVWISETKRYNVKDTSMVLYINDNWIGSNESSDVNNSSIVVYLENENGNMLFTGDIEEETESAFFENFNIDGCDVLQVAHHGSESSTLDKNISKIIPKYAIISVGENNSYGHPSDRVIDTLKNVGTCVKRTDECGAVKIKMRKGKVSICQKLKVYN